MRKFVLQIFLVLLCMSSGGCIKDNIPSEENTNSTIKSWIFSTLDPPGAYQYLDTQTKTDLSVLKGEYESLQLVLKADEGTHLQINRTNKKSPLKMIFRKLSDFEGVKDVLVPCSETIELDNHLAYLWITIYANTTIPTGKYNEEVIVKNGTSSMTLQISVTVEDITIPQKSSIPIVFGVKPDRVVKPDSNTSELEKRKKEFFDLLLNYRISPYQSSWLQNTMRLEVISSPCDSQLWQYLIGD